MSRHQFQKGHLCVKDEHNNYSYVSVDDEKYVGGTLVPIWKGWKHKAGYFNKIKEVYKNTKHQQGEKNSHFGTIWIYHEETKINKCIKKDKLDEYLTQGYKIGRYLPNLSNDKRHSLDKNQIIQMRADGLLWKEICKKLNIGKQALTKFRKENDLF